MVRSVGLLSAAAAMLACAGVRAHHAFAAEFSVDRPVQLSGTVTKVEMINPHSWIHIEVTDDSGERVGWMVEGGSPNALFRRGITTDSIPIGAELEVVGYQARDGSHRAVGRTINFADGRALFFSGTRIPDEGEAELQTE